MNIAKIAVYNVYGQKTINPSRPDLIEDLKKEAEYLAIIHSRHNSNLANLALYENLDPIQYKAIDLTFDRRENICNKTLLHEIV